MASVCNIVQKRLLVLIAANGSSLQIGHRAVSSTASRSKDETDVFAANSNTGEIDSDFDITPNIPDAEESMEKEANFRKYVERIRDVSRFSQTRAEKKYKKVLPTYSDNEARYLNDPRYFRNVYSKYGKESGVEPGIAWPTKQELLNKIEEEKTYDLSLKQKIDILVERKTEEIQNIIDLEKETDDALEKMPKMLEKYYQSVHKKRAVEAERVAKRQEVLDQAREYYGFEVDLRDKRIKDMVEKMQEEKKKAERAKKKEDERKKFNMMKQLKVQEAVEQENAKKHEIQN